MNRRKFIRNASLSLPLTLGGFKLFAGGSDWKWLQAVEETNDNILVLVQLNGGNDGLNTIVPIDQYSSLYNLRGNIMIPENDLLAMDRVDDLRLHPNLPWLRHSWNEEKVAIFQNVGYPQPNKSHFRSTDIWTSASDSDVVDGTGWLGRYLESDHPAFPEGYPNEEHPAPLALTIDTLVSATCQGSAVNLSFAVNNVASLGSLSPGGEITYPDTAFGDELAFVVQSIEQSNAYSSVISAAAEQGSNQSTTYSNSKLSKQLKVVANLISGGLGTKIYVVKLGGFDTHDAQIDAGNPLAGRHADLLADLDTSLRAFFEDLEVQGKSDKVVAMTFSEFGRRTNANDSRGTDHGEAAPLLLMGEKVLSKVHGTNPEIPDTNTRHNVPMEIDFRSVYGSVLMDLFGIDEPMAKEVVHPSMEYFQVLRKPGDVVPVAAANTLDSRNRLGQNFPNPAGTFTQVPFYSDGGHMRLEVLDLQGRMLSVLVDRRVAPGRHQLPYETRDLAPGPYVVRLRQGDHQSSIRLVKR